MMSGYPRTFPDRDAALAVIEKMHDPEATSQQWYMPSDPHADERGDAWVVVSGFKAGDPLVLRDDGSVR